MRLFDEIHSYKPCNEQEDRDRTAMLSYMESQANVLSRQNEIAHFTASAWVMNRGCGIEYTAN